jgi:CMP-N-acetylneuraminic acid synthetase
VIQHCIDELKLKPADTITMLQPTSPFRHPQDIVNAMHQFFETGVETLFSVSSMGGRGFTENGAIYIMYVGAFEEHGHRHGGKVGVYAMRDKHSYEIDYQHQLDYANLVAEEFLCKPSESAEGK